MEGQAGVLQLRLLGGFEVEGVEPAALGSRKARTLVKRLAIEPGVPVAADVLLDVLWPDADDPDNALAVLVSRLRRVLGSDRIRRSDAGYSLHADWIDVDALVDRVNEAETRLETAPASALAAATAALALARGPLLPEESDAEWAEAPRSAAARATARARHLAARAALRLGRGVDAVDFAAGALAVDEYDETALRLLMQAHVASGEAARALAAYSSFADRIADELGADPSPETRAVHAEALAQTDRGSSLDRAETPSGRPPIGVTLVGRERELDHLLGDLERSRAGAVVRVVEGEAGIGKTTLLDAFCQSAQSSALVLRATVTETRVLPMEPLLRAFGTAVGAASAEERATWLGRDASLLAPLLLPGSELEYRDVVAATDPTSTSEGALAVALLGLVSRMTRDRVVGLVIDDAHLLDSASADWAELVAARGATLPLLLVLGVRTGESERRMPSATVMTLGPLDFESAAKLVGAARAAELHERSGGHPLFLRELAEADPGDLPRSITEAVAARVDRAGEAASTLRAAAVLGPEVDLDLLSALLEQSPRQLLDHCEEGERRRVLVDSPTGYVFGHALVRDALQSAVPVARRTWLHREAARVLSARIDAEPLRIAAHARAAGDVARAGAALCDAAELAGVRYDHAAALRLADESVELFATWRGQLARARALLLLQRFAEAKDAAEQAFSMGGGAAALELAAHAVYYLRDRERAIELADQAAALSEDDAVTADCRLLAARALHALGRMDEAEQRLAPMIEERSGPVASRAFAACWLGFIADHRGDITAAEQLGRQASLADQAPVPFADLYVLQLRIHHAVLAGRATEGLALCDRLQREVVERDARRFAGRPLVYKGWALSILESHLARPTMEQAIDVAREAGNREPLGQGVLDLADHALRCGDHALAEEMLAVAGPIGHDQGVSNSWRIDLRRRYLAAGLELDQGDAARALELAEEVQALAAARGIDRYVVLAGLLGARARIRRGMSVDAERLESDVSRLAEVAAPEAWRVAATLAGELDDLGIRRLAEGWLDLLVQGAPESAEQLRSAAARLL